MISQVRLVANARTAGEVEVDLRAAADMLVDALGLPRVSYGEQVIERELREAETSRFAFRGRLILHPDTSGAREAERSAIENEWPGGRDPRDPTQEEPPR